LIILKSKAFSIIEIIVVVLILAVLASRLIPSVFDILKNTSIVKCKNELLIIQESLKKYSLNSTLKNTSIKLEDLGDEDNLFSNILNGSFKNSSWSKISNSKYKYSFNNGDDLYFYYKVSDLTFNCNKKEILCQEVLN